MRKNISLATKEAQETTQFDFGAERWQLDAEHAIDWTFVSDTPGVAKRPDSAGFTADFAHLMVPIRELARDLRLSDAQSASRVYRIALQLAELAAWMLRQSPRRIRYADVTQRDIERYVTYLRTRPHKNKAGAKLSSQSLRHHVEAVQTLYDRRDILSDSLSVAPFGSRSIQAIVGASQVDYRANQTKPIPDEAHQVLFRTAYDYIHSEGPRIVRDIRLFIAQDRDTSQGLAVLNASSRSSSFESVSPASRLLAAIDRFDKGALLRVPGGTKLTRSALAVEAGFRHRSDVTPILKKNPDVEKRFQAVYAVRGFPGGDKWSECSLPVDLGLLNGACYMVIASTTGMRDSEIRGLEPGCLRRRSDAEIGSVCWLRSLLDKAKTDLYTDWLCGEMAAEAVEILESLHTCLLTTRSKSRTDVVLPDSLFRVYSYENAAVVARPANRNYVHRWINTFVKAHQLPLEHIHPHQFRRTFARNVVRWTTVPIEALRRHFKHWSILMTEHYVGLDEELISLYYEEQRRCSEEHVYRLLSGEAAGPGGARYDKDLRQRIERGEIPRQYLGATYEAERRVVAREFVDLGFAVHQCGEYTHCAYAADGLLDSAKCGGTNHPIPRRCHPTSCIHSYIFIEDVPFYLNAIIANCDALDRLDPQARSGPEGGYLRKKVRSDYGAVEKLLDEYFAIVDGRLASFHELPADEKNSDIGRALSRRLDRDVRARSIIRKIEEGGLDG